MPSPGLLRPHRIDLRHRSLRRGYVSRHRLCIIRLRLWHFPVILHLPAQALVELDAYLALLRLHLDANYPAKRFRTWGLEAFWSERFKKDSVLAKMLVAAYIMAQSALDVSYVVALLLPCV
jgi:hypothetical protein